MTDTPKFRQALPVKTAHYYASKAKKTVIVVQEATGFILSEQQVSGRREARKVAAEHNATPWNF